MRHRTIALALAALVLGSAGQASAQSRDRDAGWWPWAGGGWEQTDRPSGRGKKAEKAERARGYDDDRDERDDRDDDYARGERRGNGPPFCRNGRGHPVHGREWCERKGWSRASWGNVIFRNPLPSNRRLEQPTLRDILGSVILGRLTDYSQRLGASGPIVGRTLNVGGGSVLQLRAGGVPLAELTDQNGDGRVDLVLLAGG